MIREANLNLHGIRSRFSSGFWQIPKNVLFFFTRDPETNPASSHLKMDGLGRLILGADLFSDCKIAVSSFVAGAMVYSR